MKFFCTKWWATEGIIEFNGHVTADGDYVSEDASVYNCLFLRLGTDAFADLAEAQANVEHKAHLNVHARERAFVKAGKLLDKAAKREIKVVKR